MRKEASAELHHVLRQMRIPEAAAGERHEDVQVLEQRFFNVLHRTEFKRGRISRKAVTKRPR